MPDYIQTPYSKRLDDIIPGSRVFVGNRAEWERVKRDDPYQASTIRAKATLVQAHPHVDDKVLQRLDREYEASVRNRKLKTGRKEPTPALDGAFGMLGEESDEVMSYVKKLSPTKVEMPTIIKEIQEKRVGQGEPRFKVATPVHSGKKGKRWEDRWTGETVTFQQKRYRNTPEQLNRPASQPIGRYIKPEKGDTAKRYFDRHTGETISYRQFRKMVNPSDVQRTKRR